MTTTSGTLYPLMVTSNNVAADQDIHFSSGFYMSNNIGHFENWILLSGRTNQLSMNSSNLLFNGHAVLTNAPGGSGITNSGVGTNNYLAKWTGTNSLGVSQINDDGTNVTIYTPLNGGKVLMQPIVGIGDTTDPQNSYGGGSTPALVVASTNQASTISVWSGNQFGTELNLSSSGGEIDNPTSSDVGSELSLSMFFRHNNQWYAGGKILATLISTNNADDNLTNIRLLGGPSTPAAILNDQGHFYPEVDGGQNLGRSTNQWMNLYSVGGTFSGALTNSTLTASTLVKAGADKALASIANAAGILTNDGSGGLGFSTNISQDITINNFTVTNLTVQSNLVVNQSIKLQGKELGSTHVNGTNVFPVVNITNTASVTWAVSGSNITATATGGDTTATNIVTLTQTTTNVSAMDFSLVQRGGVFKLVLTGNAYVGAPTGIANTSFSRAFFMIQQPSTGTCVVTFTNLYCFSEGVAPVLDTNNGSVSVIELVSDVFTNGLIHGSISTPSKRIP